MYLLRCQRAPRRLLRYMLPPRNYHLLPAAVPVYVVSPLPASGSHLQDMHPHVRLVRLDPPSQSIGIQDIRPLLLSTSSPCLQTRPLLEPSRGTSHDAVFDGV